MKHARWRSDVRRTISFGRAGAAGIIAKQRRERTLSRLPAPGFPRQCPHVTTNSPTGHYSRDPAVSHSDDKKQQDAGNAADPPGPDTDFADGCRPTPTRTCPARQASKENSSGTSAGAASAWGSAPFSRAEPWPCSAGSWIPRPWGFMAWPGRRRRSVKTSVAAAPRRASSPCRRWRNRTWRRLRPWRPC